MEAVVWHDPDGRGGYMVRCSNRRGIESGIGVIRHRAYAVTGMLMRKVVPPSRSHVIVPPSCFVSMSTSFMPKSL